MPDMPIFIGSHRIRTRGPASQEVWHLAANSIMEYAKFIQNLKAGRVKAHRVRNGVEIDLPLTHVASLLHHTVTYPTKPTELNLHSWEYAGKSQVVPMLPCTLEQTLPYLPIVVLPQTYVDVAVQFMKMDYYLYAHDMEGAASALRTPQMPDEPDYAWCNHPKDITVARQGHATVLEAYYHQLGLIKAWQDPRRPTKETIRNHYEKPIRSAIVSLLEAGDWVEDPETTYLPASDEAEAISRLNARMRPHNLGRNSHLTFSANPGKVRRTGRHPANLRTQNP